MARQTSLAKFLAAVEGSGLIVSTAPSHKRGWYGHDDGEVTVLVMNAELVAEHYEKYVATDSHTIRIRGERVGYELFFTGSGSLLGTNALNLDAYLYYAAAEKYGKGATEYRVLRDSGSRRAEYYDRGSLKDTIEMVLNISPVRRAEAAAAIATREAEAAAKAAAKAERIAAIKPDVTNAIWRVKHEAERAMSDYRGSLKSIARYAEEMLGRADEGYADESNARHLASIVADLNAAAAKIRALDAVTHSDLYPLFEGDTDRWSV